MRFSGTRNNVLVWATFFELDYTSALTKYLNTLNCILVHQTIFVVSPSRAIPIKYYIH